MSSAANSSGNDEKKQKNLKLLALGFDPESNLYTKPGLALRELLLYIVFLGIFCTVVFSPRNAASYELHKYFVDNIIEAEYHPGENFKTITDSNEFFRWMNEIFMPVMYPTHWYNGNPVEEDMLRFTLGGQNRRVGKIRVRQVRVRDDSCTVPEIFQDTIYHCWGPYTSAHEFKGVWTATNGFEGWPEHFVDHPEGPVMVPWRSAVELKELQWEGASKTVYGGGGYVQDLDASAYNATSQVQFMQDVRFVDEATRVMFVDFSTYNANADLFCVGRLVVEFLPAGSVLSSYTLRTLPLITPLRVLERDGKSAWTLALVILEWVLYFWVLIYVRREWKKAKLVGKREYFSSPWNLLEVLNLSLFLITLTMKSISWKLISDERDQMDGEAYVNLMPVSFFAQMVDNVNAFNAVICFLKMFKYLRSNKKLGQFTDTLQRASGEMVILMVIIIIVCLGYAIAFHMAFGHNLKAYRDFPESVFSLFVSTLGQFDLNELREVNRYLGPLLFVSYMILMFFVIVSMFLSIVDSAYEDVRTSLNVKTSDPLTKDLKATFNKLWKFAADKTGLVAPPEEEESATGGGRSRTRATSKSGKNGEENLEMTVEMREQEERVMEKIQALEEQQRLLSQLLQQISSGIAP